MSTLGIWLIPLSLFPEIRSNLLTWMGWSIWIAKSQSILFILFSTTSGLCWCYLSIHSKPIYLHSFQYKTDTSLSYLFLMAFIQQNKIKIYWIFLLSFFLFLLSSKKKTTILLSVNFFKNEFKDKFSFYYFESKKFSSNGEVRCLFVLKGCYNTLSSVF